MKIIELLNKIANGEEVPKKIKVDWKIYEYQGDDYGHKQDDNGIITDWLFTDNEIEKYDYISEFLNDEIEIIEEEIIGEKKKIKKLDSFDIAKQDEDEIGPDTILELDYDGVSNTLNKVYHKINELIDKVNSLENKQ